MTMTADRHFLTVDTHFRLVNAIAIDYVEYPQHHRLIPPQYKETFPSTV